MHEIDYVSLDADAECPVCGEKLANFETKSGPGAQVTLDFREVDSFYSRCTKCKSIIEFSLKDPVKAGDREKLTVDNYQKKSVIY
ncbi:MAG: hypothetical protein GXX97_06135 [Dehalococcoidales bacterium]|jgi:uncharacterized protein (UPF0212 family)|nr:hypothetical protein [Dehalococcoidales bacterium]